jgi:hypothetical protein
MTEAVSMTPDEREISPESVNASGLESGAPAALSVSPDEAVDARDLLCAHADRLIAELKSLAAEASDRVHAAATAAYAKAPRRVHCKKTQKPGTLMALGNGCGGYYSVWWDEDLEEVGEPWKRVRRQLLVFPRSHSEPPSKRKPCPVCAEMVSSAGLERHVFACRQIAAKEAAIAKGPPQPSSRPYVKKSPHLPTCRCPACEGERSAGD